MTTTTETTEGFSAAERAAIKDRAKEVRATGKKADGLNDLLAKVAEMEDADRAMAERLHVLVTDVAPDLEPRTWYGMPAYAKDGKVLLFFKPAAKFKNRYSTLGFSDVAALDDGPMWPAEFALARLTPAAEKQITALVTRAIG